MADRVKHPHLDTYASVQSSSGQDLWTLCQRRWGYTYLLGLREPGSAATDLGTEVEDEQLVPYLLHGRPFDRTRPSGDIAAEAVAALANIEPNFSLQTHLVVPSALDPTIAYQGYLDVFEPGIVPRIRDFKTSSDPEKWGKTADELRTTNRQSILYAHWVLRGGLTLGPEGWVTPAEAHGSVRLEWLYLRTRKPYRAKPVRLQLWQGDTDQAFHDLIDVPGQAIAAARKGCTDPRDLPPTVTACNAFNKPCPHLERCFAPKETTTNMLDLNSIAARIAASTPAPSGQTLTPTPGAVPPPAVSVFPPVLPVGGLHPVPSIVVAVNPPEQVIDPATVPAIDLSPPARQVLIASDEVVERSVAKRKRRTKAQIEADNTAAAAAEAAHPVAVNTSEDRGAEPCPVEYGLNPDLSEMVPTPDTVTATYGKEHIAIGFSYCEIGPFTYETQVQPGETPLQAFNRAQDMVKTIAGSALTTKLPAFLNLLQTVPGAK